MTKSINVTFDDMKMFLFVKSTFTPVKIHVGKVYNYFDDVGRIIILSQLGYWIDEEVRAKASKKKSGKTFKMPLELAKYVALAGDDTTKLTEAQIKEKMQLQFFKDPRYYTGYLSGLYSLQNLSKYPPEDVDNVRNIYYEYLLTSETMFNDCIVHAVNYALRFCYFRRREQVINFLKKRQHCSSDRAIEMKVKQGLPVSIF